MEAAARQGHATATDLAEYLVKKGVPFREAHEAVAQAVRFAESRGCELAELKLSELQRFSPAIGKDVLRRAHARRLVEEPHPPRRHGAGAGEGGDRQGAEIARLKLSRR